MNDCIRELPYGALAALVEQQQARIAELESVVCELTRRTWIDGTGLGGGVTLTFVSWVKVRLSNGDRDNGHEATDSAGQDAAETA